MIFCTMSTIKKLYHPYTNYDAECSSVSREDIAYSSTTQSKYISRVSIDNLKEILANISNEDAEKIIVKLMEEVTKENSDFHLSRDIENALIQMVTDTSVTMEEK